MASTHAGKLILKRYSPYNFVTMVQIHRNFTNNERLIMPSQKIMFPGSQGFELAAKLDTPDGVPKAYALFAHCFTCGKDLNAINRIARALNADGIALFRFDFTGLGLSNGDFANTNFSSNVEDLILSLIHI